MSQTRTPKGAPSYSFHQNKPKARAARTRASHLLPAGHAVYPVNPHWFCLCILRREALLLPERIWAFVFGHSLRLWGRNKTLRRGLRTPPGRPGSQESSRPAVAGARPGPRWELRAPRPRLTRKGWRLVTPASLATEPARVPARRPSRCVRLPGCPCRLATTAGSRRRLRSLSLCPSEASASEMPTCSAPKAI